MNCRVGMKQIRQISQKMYTVMDSCFVSELILLYNKYLLGQEESDRVSALDTLQ